MNHWRHHHVPSMRREALFADRIVACFAERPQSLHAMWERAVRECGARDAVVHEGQVLSYAQADVRIRALAAGLAARGIGQGDRVGLFMGNHPMFILSLFALQRLGAIAVPIGAREQGAGVAYMLKQCSAKGVIFDAPLLDRIPTTQEAPALALRLVHGTVGQADPGTDTASVEALMAPVGADVEAATVAPEDAAVILYTSGTTGAPKGAMLTHVNVAHSVRHFELAMCLSAEDRAALVVPCSHVTGLVAMILTTVHVGGACVIAPPFKAADFLAFMARERVSYTIMVPAMYNLLLLAPELDRCDLRHWRIGGYGGAPMPVSTIEALAERLPALGLVNAYGATETTSPTTVSPVPSDVAHADSVGAALPCVRIRVMDDHGVEVPPGESGELWIGGPMVVPGYWGNPEATAAAFTAGYWHSGDIGRIGADGFVHISDRKKDMLSRGGFKIYSVEVESRLIAFPGVIEAAIVGKPCPVLGERVHAFIHAPGIARDDEALRRHCAQTLTDYKVPESYSWRDEPLPRNANGKIIKRALRELLTA